MLGVTFLFPMMLAAAGAAAAPVIIHLMLRTRPRRMVFPALQFVRKTHQAHVSKLKLKHLLLLAMRMAAIVLLAVLLARAMIPAWRQTEDASLPTAAVVILDNSGSMNYVHRGRPLLTAAKELARQAVEMLPDGSRVAVLSTGSPQEGGEFRSDRKLIAQQIADVPAGFGGQSVSAALGRAAQLLAAADLPRKEIYLAGDCTEPSWRDEAAAGRKDLEVTVLDVGAGEDVNLAMAPPQLSASRAVVDAEVAVTTEVRSAHVGAEAVVRLELDGQPAAEQLVQVPGGGSAAVRLVFRPAKPGVLRGRLVLTREDPLEMDNVRYFTVQVDDPPTMCLVRDPSTVGRGDMTSFLMARAAAPPAQGGPGAWVRLQTATSDRLDPKLLEEAKIVLLCDVAALSETQWGQLETYARSGGCVWIVIGPLVAAQSYDTPAAQRVVPVTLTTLETSAAPVAWKIEAPRDAMLAPFAGGENPALSEVRCLRRFGCQAAADAAVLIRHGDGPPALVRRDLGDGSVVFWNFSPRREFSNLAALSQFVVLVQRTVRLLGGAESLQTMYEFAQTAAVPLAPRPETVTITLRVDGQESRPVPAGEKRGKVLTVPADRLGQWTVEFAEGEKKQTVGFSVNAPLGESDLRPVARERLRALLPAGRVTVASSAGEITRQRRMVSQPLGLSAPLLAALAALLIGESFFANRFYRRTTTSDAP